jgi:hypothetical protein
MAGDEGCLGKLKMKLRTNKLCLAANCLLCAIVVWRYGADLEGTEFIGGWLTGPLLNLYDVGTFLFVPALLLAFFFRRIAAAFALTASLLCLPLYLYFVATGPFRSVFRGEYSVPLQASFVWNSWAALGILTLVVATCVSLWNLATPARASKSAPGRPEQQQE